MKFYVFTFILILASCVSSEDPEPVADSSSSDVTDLEDGQSVEDSWEQTRTCLLGGCSCNPEKYNYCCYYNGGRLFFCRGKWSEEFDAPDCRNPEDPFSDVGCEKAFLDQN